MEKQQNNCLLSVIIVNHNSDQHLISCISSLKEPFSGISYEIIIVNNGENKKFDLGLKNCKIINIENKGFGHANNLGASQAKGEFLLMLNPDTLWQSGNITKAMTLSKEKPAVAGFCLLGSSGKIQPWSTGKKVTPFDIILNNVGILRSKKIWLSKNKKKSDWVSGAAMLVHKSCFNAINGFDEKFFLYYEDVDFCLRVRKKGFNVWYMPEIKILHHGGSSMSNQNNQKNYYFDSQNYYLKKHFGRLIAFLMKKLRLLFH